MALEQWTAERDDRDSSEAMAVVDRLIGFASPTAALRRSIQLKDKGQLTEAFRLLAERPALPRQSTGSRPAIPAQPGE
jgi:hypothetical protein